MELKELGGAKIDVPRAVGFAIKALAEGAANPEQQKLAITFIIDALAGIDRESFLFVDDVPMVLAWREGRRWAGISLREIIRQPIPDPEPPPLPPARTITESARRRGPNPD